ncbi:MAG: lipopolysaccharide heptosyltransferase II [Candidatus Aceula meridiana]|nr:lipopolysaccharide heptosyltransferase II [Candidatus Aceula meridiana]
MADSKQKRILIVNIFGIGDVLFTTPLIQNIKKAMPDVVIGYMSNRRTSGFLEDNPQIDKVFVYEKDEYRKFYKESKKKVIKKFQNFLALIKQEKFDVVIDVSLNEYVGFFLWLSGIPVRIGFNYKNRSPFLTKKIPLESYKDKHVIESYLEILKYLDVPVASKEMSMPLNPKDVTWAQDFLLQKQIAPDQKLIAIIPGGGASWGKAAKYKRWPAENYTKLADKIVEKTSDKIILLGGNEESALCKAIAQKTKAPLVEAFGTTTVGQFAALIARCQVAVVNDGGPLHVAVAQGIKTVSIFGPVDENVYGPYPQDGHKVAHAAIACRPCYRRFRVSDCSHHNCLKLITVENVFKKVEEVL